MKPAQYKTYMPQGATWRRTFTWKINDTPVNLTGYHARMQVRDARDSASAVISVDDQLLGGITLGGAAGTIAIEVAEEDTAALSFSAGYKCTKYADLEMIEPGGAVVRLIDMELICTMEVTRG